MKTIPLDINTTSVTIVIGHVGESLTTKLSLTGIDDYAAWDIYLDFSLPNGIVTRTPKLENATYIIPGDFLTRAGLGKLNVIVKNGEEERVVFLCSIRILDAINADSTLELTYKDVIQNHETRITELEIKAAILNGVIFDQLAAWAEKVKTWITGNYSFLTKHTRAALPNALNENYLASGQFESGDSSGDWQRYTPWQAGASETQTLLLRGALKAYLATGNIQWKNFALNMANAMMTTLFKGATLPATPNGLYYLPHWLYNAKQDTQGDAWYPDKQVTFTAGVGTLVADHTARKICSVRAADATLSWDNPYAPIVGTQYKVASYTTDGAKTFTVTLQDTSFSGTALVVYTDEGGPTITKGELMEAWPYWRPLDDTEIDCAVDSLWWAYDCFKLLSQITGDIQWTNALAYLRQIIPDVTNVNDFDDWFAPNVGTDNPLSVKGMYWQSTRSGVAIQRNTSTGAVDISIPAGSGWSEYGNYNADETWGADNSLEVTVASTTAGFVRFCIDPTDTYDPAARYTAIIPLDGSGSQQTMTLHLSDFIYIAGLAWDIAYLSSTYAVYKDDGSTCTTSQAADGSHVSASYSVSVYAQLVPSFTGAMSACPAIKYAASAGVSLRLKDAAGWYWYYNLPAASSAATVHPAMSEFTTAGHQPNSGTAPGSFTGDIQEIAFVFSGSGTFDLYRLGAGSSPATGAVVANVLFYSDSAAAQTFSVYRVRWLPGASYKYAPYVAPFSAGILQNQIQTWRGLPYTGYQAPYWWLDAGNANGANAILQYLKDAQDAYQTTHGIRGPFASAYIWDRWDSADYGTPGTWYQDTWGGFEYRAIETVARTLATYPALTLAKTILTDFLTWLAGAWASSDDVPPTVFPASGAPQKSGEEPHCVALILRTAIYAYQSGVISASVTTPLIMQCLRYLDRMYVSDTALEVCGTWSINPAGGTWNQFWDGEILTSLAMALDYLGSES